MNTNTNSNYQPSRKFPYRYNGMVRTSIPPSEWRFAEPQFSRPNSSQPEFVQDNASNYSACTHNLEGHVYEEVGPPSHPPPYHPHTHMMDTQVDYHARHRGSPASLCSECSSRMPELRRPYTPPCRNPACNSCGGMPSCNIHTSMPRYPGHPAFQPHSLHHHPLACTLPSQGCAIHSHSPVSHPMNGSNNNRYHTTSPEHDSSSQSSPSGASQTSSKKGSRPLSPFALLTKTKNRDSKASTNNMLDNASNKSLLMCNKKWLLAISITLVIILVISVAVGVVVTVGISGGSGPGTASPVVLDETSKFHGILKVIGGDKSQFLADYHRPQSDAYITYTTFFSNQVGLVLQDEPRLNEVVDRVEVLSLQNGSVIIDFLIYTKQKYQSMDMTAISKEFHQALYIASNTTSSNFARNYIVLLSSIQVQPVTDMSGLTTDLILTTSNQVVHITTPQPITEPDTTTSQTTVPPTPTTTTTKVFEPSGVCQPIVDNSVCAEMPWSETTYPNIFGQTSQQGDVEYYMNIVDLIQTSTACYDYLKTFACSVFVPKCGIDNSRVPPCRSLCEASLSNCQNELDRYRPSEGAWFNRASLNCSALPESDDLEVCVSAVNCPANRFKCDNTCRPIMLRCDGTTDCDDGTDEQNCEGFVCVDGQYECANALCRPKIWQCDHVDDCGDNSDELDCLPEAPCTHGEFKCTDGHDTFGSLDDLCISATFTCDRTNDCSDGSDETEELCQGRGRDHAEERR